MAADYYTILRVKPNADQETIEKAYRQLALLYHPDRNTSPEATLWMQQVNEAYSILRHPLERAKYDRQSPPAPRPAGPPRAQPQTTRQPAPHSHPPAPAAKAVPIEEPIILFSLGGQSYAVAVSEVEKILPMQPLIPSPSLANLTAGAVQWENGLLPVLDMRRRLGYPQTPPGRSTRILVTAVSGMQTGWIIDAIESFVPLGPSAIDPPPPVWEKDKTAVLSGIARLGDRLVPLLSLSNLLSRQECDLLRSA